MFENIFAYGIGPIALLVGFIILLPNIFFTVGHQSAAIVERFGKFVRVAYPGLNFKIPFLEKVQGHVSMRILQLDVEIETKTYDDVFVRVVTSVQYHVLPGKIYEAFYRLDSAEQQIQSYVFDVVRARIPKIKLDDVFSKKDEIADSVKDELEEAMDDFGYGIIKALVTDIDPDSRVKTAMNEINEAQRLRIAATERGEAEKIIKIKQAEADAESKILQGKGIAGERKAIIDGLKHSLEEFNRDVKNTDTKDVMNLIMMAQYFDTLKDMSSRSQTNTILIPHSPSGFSDLQEQIRNGIITGNQVSHVSPRKKKS
jgi:regulator of protease activity HflC (stomatin/prohibitin superfamily)